MRKLNLTPALERRAAEISAIHQAKSNDLNILAIAQLFQQTRGDRHV